MENESFLTSRDVCNYLGVSTTLLNGLEKSGHLMPARKMPLSNKRLYSAEDVMAFKLSVQYENVRKGMCHPYAAQFFQICQLQ